MLVYIGIIRECLIYLSGRKLRMMKIYLDVNFKATIRFELFALCVFVAFWREAVVGNGSRKMV